MVLSMITFSADGRWLREIIPKVDSYYLQVDFAWYFNGNY